MSTPTPWGVAQHKETIGRGFSIYTTAGHGGAILSSSVNELIPISFRSANGAYEEDSDINIPLALSDLAVEGGHQDIWKNGLLKSRCLDRLKEAYPLEWAYYKGESLDEWSTDKESQARIFAWNCRKENEVLRRFGTHLYCIQSVHFARSSDVLFKRTPKDQQVIDRSGRHIKCSSRQLIKHWGGMWVNESSPIMTRLSSNKADAS